MITTFTTSQNSKKEKKKKKFPYPSSINLIFLWQGQVWQMDGNPFRYIFSWLYFQQKVEFGAMLPFYSELLHKYFQWVQQLQFCLTHLGQLRLKIMTLGPSHKLDGEEEISLGRPKLLFKYGKFTSTLFHCTSHRAKRWKWKWHRNFIILLSTSFSFPQEWPSVCKPRVATYLKAMSMSP